MKFTNQVITLLGSSLFFIASGIAMQHQDWLAICLGLLCGYVLLFSNR